jgi:hypothetical protein
MSPSPGKHEFEDLMMAEINDSFDDEYPFGESFNDDQRAAEKPRFDAECTLVRPCGACDYCCESHPIDPAEVFYFGTG